jgi:hypothetical protein
VFFGNPGEAENAPSVLKLKAAVDPRTPPIIAMGAAAKRPYR